MRHLTFCSEAEQLDFFFALLSKRGEVERKEDCVLARPESSIVFFSRIRQMKLMPQDVTELYIRAKKYPHAEIRILCSEYTPQAALTARSVPYGTVTLYNEAEVFLIMKEHDFFPEVAEPEKKKGGRLQLLLSAAFCRKKVKGYLLSAAALVLASIFMRYTLYYRIFASLLLIAALLSCFNPTFEKKPPP
jgi:hypothetical protein